MPELRQHPVPASATNPRPTGRGATRRLLVDVAERMFAEEGLDGVSLRAVAQAAGQRNNSAAQYHFGSRDGLVAAIVETRSAPVEQRRAERVAQLRATGTPASVRDLVALFVVPLAECLDQEPTWYLRFLTRLVEAEGMADAPGLVHPEGLRHMHRELRRLLPHVSRPTFARRLRWLAEITLRALADLEREHADGGSRRSSDVVEDLLTMLQALLEAPDPARVSR